MNTESIKFDGHLIQRLYSEHELQTTIQRLADEIYLQYKDKKPLLVGILKGANLFLGDIARELGRGNPEIGREPLGVEIDFLQVTSYVGEQSSGTVTRGLEMTSDIHDRHVLLVEDIVDTGRTMVWLKDELMKKSPASLAVCVLLDKKEKRIVPMEPEFTGISIADKFVVGYGLDVNQHLRNLPFIGVVVN